MTQTFKLQIRQTNIYDANDGFQLILRAMEENRDMFLWEDASVAACKTMAGDIFKGTLTWTGDLSTGATGSPGQATDVLWADMWFTFGTGGVTGLGVITGAGGTDAGI